MARHISRKFFGKARLQVRTAELENVSADLLHVYLTVRTLHSLETISHHERICPRPRTFVKASEV